jgi:hypothetical protein
MSWCHPHCCKIPKEFLFKDKHKMKLKNVRGEPSDINWDNLFIPGWEKFLRKAIVFLVISVFMIGSIVGTIVATEQQVQLQIKSSACPE